MANTHSDEHLTNCFVSYFIHLKESVNPLAYSKIHTSLFTALRGLDEEYSTYEFVNKMKGDFELIAQHLDKVARELYKEERSKVGLYDKNAIYERTLSVSEISAKLGISEQAVRKAIKEERLKATLNNKGAYEVTEKDFKEFANSRKRCR